MNDKRPRPIQGYRFAVGDVVADAVSGAVLGTVEGVRTAYYCQVCDAFCGSGRNTTIQDCTFGHGKRTSRIEYRVWPHPESVHAVWYPSASLERV